MAIAFRAAASATGVGVSSLVVNVPTGTQNNDVMVAVIEAGTSNPNIINTPTGWTLLNSQTASPNVRTYWRVASSEPASYTWTFNTTTYNVSGIIASYSGTATSSQINQHAAFTAGTSTTTITAASVTTTVAGCMLVFVGGCNTANASFTGPTSFTQRATPTNTTTSAILADMVQSSAGATGSITATAATSGNNGGSIIAIAPGPTAPVNTVAPAVTGTTTVGQVLTTTNGTWTDDGSPTFTYQWQRDVAGNGVYGNISAATSSTYTLVDADDGCHILCVVTDSTPDGNTAANSNAVGTVVEPVPVNSVAPSVSGSTPVGSVLSTTNGTWTHMGGLNPSYTYQWTRDGANIAAATSSTYTTVSADITHAVGCTVTAHNTGGTASQASSNTITVTPAPTNDSAVAGDFAALLIALQG